MPYGMVSGNGEPVPQLQSRNVCVVGAGMAGLAAARELRREGHAVTVLEQCGDVGGQWLYDPSTDGGDLLESAAEPVSVHSSMYASLRLISGREAMGFSDFQFVPRPGRDARSFPGHREVYCFLRDFCDAFGLTDAIRLNTRVIRVAMAPPPATTRQWAVRSVTGETVTEEVFDAVVVANGHYSQPRLPSIRGMGEWTRRQLHSHSYRVPEPFRGEVVVMVGCGDSGRDIALDLRRVAREVHLSANTSPSSESATTPAMSRMLANHANLHLHPQIERLHADGRVVFVDGSCVVADSVIYCTGYVYSFPFLDTGGAVTVDADDNVVGPLFEHVFPPSLAPSLSFVGLPVRVLAPWYFEAQGKWVAQVLSGRRALPSEEEMARSVEEHYRTREAAGVPRKSTHDIAGVEPEKLYEFGGKYGDYARIEDWKIELIAFDIARMNDDVETYRELDRTGISDNVRRGLQRWLGGPSDQTPEDHQTTDVAAVDDAQDMPAKLVLDVAEVDTQDMTEEHRACLAGIPA